MKVVLAWVCVACAVLTALSWGNAVRIGRPFPRRSAAAVLGWAVLSALAFGVSALGTGAAMAHLTGVLLTLAAVAALVGVGGIVRFVRVSGRLEPAVAEAVLVGSAVVTIVWAVTDPPVHLPWAATLSLLLTLVDVGVVVLIVRLPVVSPSLVVDGGFHGRLVTGALAASLLAVGDGLDTLTRLGVRLPAELAVSAGAAGYLAAAVVPWVPRSGRAHRGRPSRTSRVIPYALVACALIAAGARGFASGTGPVPVLLVGLVVGGLVAVQALALRENTALLADLEASGQRLAALIENTSDVIMRLDRDGRVLTANAATSRLLHVSPGAVAGRRVSDLARSEEAAAVDEVVSAVAGGFRPTARVELRLAPPATGTAELRLRAVPDGAVVNLHDVTDAVELRGRLERMARFDQMTGLANRTHLLDVVARWLDSDSLVTVLYGDLDGFKAVNDRFGHLAGDAVLVEVAERLSRVVRHAPAVEGMAARIGGDEFVLVLRGGQRSLVRGVAEHVVTAVRQPFRVRDRAVVLGMSVGVADSVEGSGCGPGATGAAELVHRADLAMFAAKETGHGRVAGWDAALDTRAQRRVDIAIGLRRALDTGHLDIAYQPIVRLADGMVVAVEALLRVPGGDRAPGALGELADVVSPAELVEVAEDTGVIAEMGHWVLAAATRQVAEWRTRGHDLTVAVNISVAQLLTEDFRESVTRVLAAALLPPDRLILEITESQLAGYAGGAVEVLDGLQSDDVVLAIDDFGTGYSSLAYLRHLPTRILKIDRTLLDGVGDDPRATTLVRAIGGVARSRGQLVVAEGIEDLSAARLLRDLGAWAGQGFALSPALGPAEMLALLEESALDLDGFRTRPLRGILPSRPEKSLVTQQWESWARSRWQG